MGRVAPVSHPGDFRMEVLGGLWDEVRERQVLLSRLTQNKAMRRHQARDHTPFRKGCPICVAVQGRQRAHWRASFTGLYSR